MVSRSISWEGHRKIITRIIIYTGHREMGLVLAGRYFLKKV